MRTARTLSFVGAAFFVLLGAIGVTSGPASAQTVPPTTASVQANGIGLSLDDGDPPMVSGTARYGEPLQAYPGAWTGTGTITYTYRWQQCDNVGCTDIAGATGATYIPVASDIDHMLGFIVTATDDVQSADAPSDNWTDPVEGIPPTGPAPTIAGIARVGETLTASVGEWTGEGPLTYTWSWGRIESLDAQSGDSIDGATSNTYTVTPADLGMILVAAVQVTGPLGTGYSGTPTAPVVASPAAGASLATSTANTITVSGSGFAPFSDVTVVLRSDPVTLGVAHTDATGSFTATFAIPPGVSAGVHTLVFTGVDAAGNPVTVEQSVVIAVAAGTLPVTGGETLPLTLIAAGLILAGVLSLRAGRRRAAPAA